MKRLIFTAAVCCALMACGGAKTNSESADNKQESAAETVNQKADPFTMVDGKLYDLKGKVKSCDVSEYNSDKDGVPNMEEFVDEYILEFDGDDGFCTKNTDKESWKTKRNGMGQVRAFTQYVEDYQCEIYDSIFYNEQGFVESKSWESIESIAETKYKYSGDVLESSVMESAGEGECSALELFYTILDTDDHGNWTRRLVRTDNYDWSDGDEKPSTPDSFCYTVQLRKIVYY